MRGRANMMASNKFLLGIVLSISLLKASGIAADITNQPPAVWFINPQDGETFVGPTEVRLVAYAEDREDGYDLKVEFFEGTNSLGFGTFVRSICPPPLYCPNIVRRSHGLCGCVDEIRSGAHQGRRAAAHGDHLCH